MFHKTRRTLITIDTADLVRLFIVRLIATFMVVDILLSSKHLSGAAFSSRRNFRLAEVRMLCFAILPVLFSFFLFFFLLLFVVVHNILPSGRKIETAVF